MSLRLDMMQTPHTMRNDLKVYRVMEVDEENNLYLTPYMRGWMMKQQEEIKKLSSFNVSRYAALQKCYNERQARKFPWYQNKPWGENELKSLKGGFYSFVYLHEAVAFVKNRLAMKRFSGRKWVILEAIIPAGTRAIYGFRARMPIAYSKHPEKGTGRKRKQNLRAVRSEYIHFADKETVLKELKAPGDRYEKSRHSRRWEKRW
jgi:hypothetical protein